MKHWMFRLRWMAIHWRPYAIWIPTILALTLANAARLVAVPWLFKQIIDGIQTSATSQTMFTSAGLLLAVGVVRFAVYATLQTLRAGTNIKFEYSVRTRAFEHTLQLGPAPCETFVRVTSSRDCWTT